MTKVGNLRYRTVLSPKARPESTKVSAIEQRLLMGIFSLASPKNLIVF